MKVIFNINLSLLVLGFTLLMPSAGFTHHSYAMYDPSVSQNFTGKLIRFVPDANHVEIFFEVLDENGKFKVDESSQPVIWGIETGSSLAIGRLGVTEAVFPIGTVLNVSLNPLRNGERFGLQDGPIIHCRVTIPVGGCNEQTGEVFMNRRGQWQSQ